MKLATARIQYAVPQTLAKRLEIAQAIRVLVQQDETERLQKIKRPEAAPNIHEMIHDFVVDLRRELRKAGFDPNEPRVPAGNPDGGQWTRGGGDSLSDETPDNDWIPGAQYAAYNPSGKFPPPPPGYDPKTWKQGQWPNGRIWLEDPEGNKYTLHPEDDGHWRHWDKQDGGGKGKGRLPPNSFKLRPGEKTLKENQSLSDPNGDAPPWTPSPYVPVAPIDPIPFPDIPDLPVFVPE
jgi:hypothetical protein